MAAALAALNNYLNNTLLITSEAVCHALNDQGLTSFDNFATLTEDDISEICSNVQKPGGTIDNPAHDDENPIAGIPARIPNPGRLIGHVHEKRLKMLRYYVYHLSRIQRTFNAPTATLNRLSNLYRFQEHEKDFYNEIDLPDKLTSVDNIRVTLEDLDDYLTQKRGTTGIPLSAYVREQVDIPTGGADDPDLGFGQLSYLEEMIIRAPHTGPTYAPDNTLIWDAIRHITHEGPAWGWVQPFARHRNGRLAYFALKTHYLGDAFQARLRAKADQILDTTYYDGKKQNFNYKRYKRHL